MNQLSSRFGAQGWPPRPQFILIGKQSVGKSRLIEVPWPFWGAPLGQQWEEHQRNDVEDCFMVSSLFNGFYVWFVWYRIFHDVSDVSNYLGSVFICHFWKWNDDPQPAFWCGGWVWTIETEAIWPMKNGVRSDCYPNWWTEIVMAAMSHSKMI